MAPRKAKTIATKQENVQKETPVVFFLKIKDNAVDQIVSAGDILESMMSDVTVFRSETEEETTLTEKFNTDLLKNILTKVNIREQYTPQTACFWCCHGFSWTPTVLPISYDAYKNIYHCEGNFCCPECALSFNYANHMISDSTRWNRHALLGNLYAELYRGDKILSPAPPRELLRMFGGYLDIDQYRQYTIAGSNEMVLSEMPPIRLHFPSMNVQGPLRDVKKYVSLSNDVVEKASEQLRLKRSKPVNVNVPTLDMCIKKS